MSLIFGAALQGLGAAGQTISRGMMDSVSRDDAEERRRREREEERQFRMEEMRERETLRGGGATGGGRAPALSGVLASQMGEGGEDLIASRMGMSVPEYRSFVEAERTGDYSGFEVPTAQEENFDGPAKALPPGFEEFKARKRAERGKLLETYAFSGDADKIAGARQKDAETGLLSKAATGDQGARDALLVNRGKDPRETTARAADEQAAADLRGRTNPNLRGGGGGGARPTQEKLTSQLSQLRMLLKQEEEKGFRGDPAVIAQHRADIADISGQLRSIRQGGAAPAATPAATKSPKAPDMAKANAIRQQVREGKLSREDGLKQLRELGFK
jgi:hypothetical protein